MLMRNLSEIMCTRLPDSLISNLAQSRHPMAAGQFPYGILYHCCLNPSHQRIFQRQLLS